MAKKYTPILPACDECHEKPGSIRCRVGENVRNLCWGCANQNVEFLSVTPVEGMPATVSIGSDRWPYRVVEVVSANRIRIQKVQHWRIDNNGYGGVQVYEYGDVEGEPEVWTLRQDGRWRLLKSAKGSGYRLVFGVLRAYSDPSV